jgi:SIR2-like protein
MEPKKIAYLFGAGATHAELLDLAPRLIENGRGLLISDVSRRVIERARFEKGYLDGVEMVSATSGALNIELLISLIENSKIHNWESKTHALKSLVQTDITGILTKRRLDRFYLHKAVFELHKHRRVIPREALIGCVSLNYDDVLDRAYQEFYGAPSYCFSLEPHVLRTTSIPLLKLHGSFKWKRQEIRGRIRTIEIIPLGSNKNYLHAPYNFIWTRAMEVLVECDILRVIGCSMSQNDAHLIDLLFKAHLERKRAFDIEVIASQDTGDAIRANYGFFPQIRTLREIEGQLVPDPAPDNPFRSWLKYKTLDMIKKDSERRNYLEAVVS